MPFYENGKFHIFYLYDARNTLPTFHPWYKVMSTDFATFNENSEMIPTGTVTDQDGALGTGSVFKKDGTYYAFYTGHNGILDPKEKIMLATSTDLKTWTKNPSFQLQASWGYDRNEFRDPIIIEDKSNGTFKMLIATRSEVDLVSNVNVPWRAVIAQYSKWQVARDFRSLYGTTPYRYVTLKRLQKAKALIERGQPLAHVAFSSGFADQSHLTRHFKQCFGTTPKVWAKLHQ